ncbi:MAG: carboxypeptidase regulatory-like domain-containing protein [Acidobacteriota bacterium]
MKSKIIFALMLSMLFLNVPLYAQTAKATIRGTVTDPQGARIAKAEIKLTNKATGEVRTTTANDEGEYAISQLLPGVYEISAQSSGFTKYQEEVLLNVNQELRLNLNLKVGAAQVEQNVSREGSSQLKKESASLGTVIENRQVTNLPLDGRNFLELTLLVPGAAPAAPGSAGSVRGDFAFSINGSREDSNYFLLDGAFNVDPKLNTFAVKPAVDAIREFEVLTNSYDASFGRNVGGQINVVTQSGSNSFHGTVYEFFRNGALDARNFFAPRNEAAPKYSRNQFGGSFGGPVRKDRTFFFADYEGTRIREGLTRVTNVPTLAERNGDFSQSLFNKPRDPFTQQPFPGNQIPGFFINPIGQAIAKLYPLPNRNTPLANFVSSPIARDKNHQFDVRADHRFNDASTLAFRYSFADRDFFEPFAGTGFSTIPGYGNDVTRRGQNLLLSETHIFTNKFINEARFAVSRIASTVFQENAGTSVNKLVGLPDISTNPRDFGLTAIRIAGFSPLGHEFNNPQDSTTTVYQFADNASYTKGAHLFKFGFDYRATQQNAFRDVLSRGLIGFIDQAFTGNALADLLLGLPAFTTIARVDNPQRLRNHSYNFYVNDNWRVSPNFSLTAGLRYEYNSPSVDADDRASIYDPATRSFVAVGTNGIPRSGYEADKNNFAPRLGFAWTVKESTVVRGGYGFYYDQSSLAPGELIYFNSPYYQLNTYFTFLPNVLLTLNDPFPANFPIPSPQSAFTYQRDLRTPYTQQWNLNVQQQLGKSRVLEIAYVGSKGTKLITARDINQPAASPSPFNFRPLPQFADINILESRANSNYNALQTRFQQRLSAGLSVLTAYTWSRSIDDASGFFTSAGDPNFPQDSNNVSLERARSSFDVAHRFSLSYSYDLPFGNGHSVLGDNGWLTHLVSGWQTLGIVTLQTGRPFTVAILSDIDNSNTGRSGLGFGANDRPNVVGNPSVGNQTPDQWFNTSAFAFPAFGSFGDAGRNILEGPGYQNFNVSLIKNTRLKEDVNLQFRAEFFNLFNHANFDLPDNFLGSPTFGKILSAQAPRRIQFGLKLLF